MARGKKRAVSRGRPRSARQAVDPDSNEDAQGPAQVEKQDVEVQRREVRSYVDFWKGLSYKHPRRPHDSIKNRSAKSNRSPNHEQVSEKYRLQTGSSSKQVLLLQYPDKRRNELAGMHQSQQPSEIRMKPKSGVVEVDIPIPSSENCDREKSIAFGSAWRKSNALYKNGAHGLAGGFGVGSRKSAAGENGVQMGEPSKTELLEDFENSVSQGFAMEKFTLGGRIVPLKGGDPIYMVATFSGATCKWTKVDAIVQLRPQFHHLDAVNEEARHAASTLSAKPEDKARANRAEDVNMMVKDSADADNGDMYGGMNDTAKLLREMQNEKWRTLKWQKFRSDEASVVAYDQTLTPRSDEETPYLISEMTKQQYLDAISCPRIDPIRQGEQISLAMAPSAEPEDGSADNQPGTKVDSDDHDDDEHGNGLNDVDVVMGDDAQASASGLQPTNLPTDRDIGNDDAETQTHGTDIASTLPKSASRPDPRTERLIEQVCRVICIAPPHRAGELERKLCAKFNDGDNGDEDAGLYAFLRPEHEYHPFFRWRLGRNQADEGIPPEEDYNRS